MTTSEERSEAVRGTPEPIRKIATVKVLCTNSILAKEITVVGDVEDAVKGMATMMAGQQFLTRTDSLPITDVEILSISYQDYSDDQ